MGDQTDELVNLLADLPVYAYSIEEKCVSSGAALFNDLQMNVIWIACRHLRVLETFLHWRQEDCIRMALPMQSSLLDTWMARRSFTYKLPCLLPPTLQLEIGPTRRMCEIGATRTPVFKLH